MTFDQWWAEFRNKQGPSFGASKEDCRVIWCAAILNTGDELRTLGYRAAWDTVNALIREGELPEEQHWERNGLVFAANAVAALMGWPLAKYAEEIEPPST